LKCSFFIFFFLFSIGTAEKEDSKNGRPRTAPGASVVINSLWDISKLIAIFHTESRIGGKESYVSKVFTDFWLEILIATDQLGDIWIGVKIILK
jgi:hypothetical protein